MAAARALVVRALLGLACLAGIALLAPGAPGATGAGFTSTTGTTASLAAAPSFYAGTVQADTPVLYWRLGEASGTVAADVMGTYPGTYSGTLTQGVTGKTPDGDTATDFSGTTGRVRTVNGALTFAGTAPFSLEAWVKVGDTTAGTTYQYGRVFTSELTNAQGRQGYNVHRGNTYSVSGALNTYFCFERYRDGVYSGQCTGNVTVAAWHHLVFTYNGSTLRIYVDGTLQSSAASTVSLLAGTQPLSVGSGPTNAFYGTIDEAAVYDYALTLTQIQAHRARAG